MSSSEEEKPLIQDEAPADVGSDAEAEPAAEPEPAYDAKDKVSNVWDGNSLKVTLDEAAVEVRMDAHTRSARVPRRALRGAVF